MILHVGQYTCLAGFGAGAQVAQDLFFLERGKRQDFRSTRAVPLRE